MNSAVQASASSVQGYLNTAVELLIGYAPSVLLAILVLLIGLKIISGFTHLLDKTFEKRNVDPTLRPFIRDLLSWSFKALLFISAASMIGIKTTSFVAIIGAAGLAIGLALQGTLANFAGGVLLLLFKPFKVGDLIEAQGFIGNVEEIQIFVTKIISPGNHLVVIPNGALSNGSLKNISAKEYVRVDRSLGIAYGADLKQAKEVLLKVLQETPHVLTEPAPFVGVTDLGDSSVNLVIRSFTSPAHYWDVYFHTLEHAKLALDEAHIEIPFPQRVVHSAPKEA